MVFWSLSTKGKQFPTLISPSQNNYFQVSLVIPKYNWDRLKKKGGCCKYRSFDPIMFTCGFCIFCVSFSSPLKLFRFAIFLIVIWPVWLVITTILFKKIKTFQENIGTSQWTMNEGARTQIFQCPLLLFYSCHVVTSFLRFTFVNQHGW